MRHATFPPPPPLPPLPPPLKSSGSTNRCASPTSEGIDLRASRNSDTEIWKAGLGGNKGEMEVVFGELKPDQLMGKMHKLLDPSRSIIIPSYRRQGGRGDNGVTELKSASGGPFRGALNSSRSQIPGIKNSRFKEYLKRYFPRENVIMQPLENVIRCMVAEGLIARNPSAPEVDVPSYHSPLRLSDSERALCASGKPTPQQSQEISIAMQQTTIEARQQFKRLVNRAIGRCDSANGKKIGSSPSVTPFISTYRHKPRCPRPIPRQQICQNRPRHPKVQPKSTSPPRRSCAHQPQRPRPGASTDNEGTQTSTEVVSHAVEVKSLKTPILANDSEIEKIGILKSVEVTNEVSEIGDVCQQLMKCVATVQNRILDSILPSLVVMGKFGELGERTDLSSVHHFTNLQTVILETAFAEKLKTISSMCSRKATREEEDRVKFLLLPRWEQQFLGLRRRQCTGRVVLAYEELSARSLDYLMRGRRNSFSLWANL